MHPGGDTDSLYPQYALSVAGYSCALFLIIQENCNQKGSPFREGVRAAVSLYLPRLHGIFQARVLELLDYKRVVSCQASYLIS